MRGRLEVALVYLADLWFQHLALVVTDIDASIAFVVSAWDLRARYDELRAAGVDLRSPGVVELDPPSSAEGAFLLADPTGHVVELRRPRGTRPER